MKKFSKILIGIALLVSGFIFSSCQQGDEITEVKEILAGPKNTWCRMPVSYKNSDSASEASLYAYFYYTENSVTQGRVTLEPGLTIVITTKDNQDQSSIISGLVSGAYILKTFPKDSSVSVDDGDTSNSFTGSREKWSAIYWAKDELRSRTYSMPTQLNGNGGLNWDSIKETFSWKRLLANYLLSILDS